MKFEDHVKQMKALSGRLVKYSFPVAPPQDEEIISCLKQREITIDGYEVIVYFNKCRYEKADLETLQVFGKYFSFIPFSVICKIAVAFLGKNELSLIEVIHNRDSEGEEWQNQYSRKIHVWTVYYKSGVPIPNPFVSVSKTCSYDGLSFSLVDDNQVNFF